MFWIFLIYSFIGWMMEVAVVAINGKKFVNRGFLNGPICPIYGFGVLLVLGLLTPIMNNVVLFFIWSIILTTALEFIVGFVLEKVFHQKWWDYSYKKFNLFGYISLDTSLAWGVLCVVLLYLIHPLFINLVSFIPYGIGVVFLSLAFTLIMIDLIFTLSTLFKVKRNMVLIEKINHSIEQISNVMGKGIADNAMAIAKITIDNKQELERLINKRQIIVNQKVLGYKRLVKAYPQLRKKLSKIKKDDSKEK